ncbi:hypothetical protein H4219_005043 [Mycoemilia scoparia]|uniref:Ankyrin repeat-containing protein n=1 Tax=Mycoemilia scoparia TaxID=417184 RepID=A0A9W8DQT3_9FUNG|nr:hypothetical protein H4219_005043 [Mycoemilia scoparia]
MDEQMLLEAASIGNTKAVQKLLANNFDPNYRHKLNGWTALHWATHRNHEKIVSMLLESGADPNLKNSNNQTALDMANSPSTISMLLSRNALYGDSVRLTNTSNAAIAKNSDNDNNNVSSDDGLKTKPSTTTTTTITTSSVGGDGSSNSEKEKKQPPAVNFVPNYLANPDLNKAWEDPDIPHTDKKVASDSVYSAKDDIEYQKRFQELEKASKLESKIAQMSMSQSSISSSSRNNNNNNNNTTTNDQATNEILKHLSVQISEIQKQQQLQLQQKQREKVVEAPKKPAGKFLTIICYSPDYYSSGLYGTKHRDTSVFGEVYVPSVDIKISKLLDIIEDELEIEKLPNYWTNYPDQEYRLYRKRDGIYTPIHKKQLEKYTVEDFFGKPGDFVLIEIEPSK